MPAARARVATPLASRYLQQLCKHFAHKTEATFTPEQGRVAFPMGTCAMTAADGVLTLDAHAAGPAALEQVKEIVGGHLQRFAFREKPAIVWD